MSARAAVEELVAPDDRVATHPVVRGATHLVVDVLAPHAAAADDPARGVDPAHLALLAGHGLLGGGALRLDQPEQRWAREAAFHIVGAQTADVRTRPARRLPALTSGAGGAVSWPRRSPR